MTASTSIARDLWAVILRERFDAPMHFLPKNLSSGLVPLIKFTGNRWRPPRLQSVHGYRAKRHFKPPPLHTTEKDCDVNCHSAFAGVGISFFGYGRVGRQPRWHQMQSRQVILRKWACPSFRLHTQSKWTWTVALGSADHLRTAPNCRRR